MKRWISTENLSGVSWGIQCEAFSTRTSVAFGISATSRSPSRNSLPRIVNTPEAERRRSYFPMALD